MKVATVTSENLDTMATLPISVSRHSHQQHAEKTAAVVKEKEQETKSTKSHFMYHQIKRFVILSSSYICQKKVAKRCSVFINFDRCYTFLEYL